MTSPCETTAYIDVGAVPAVSRAFQSRTAATARADMSAIDSPPSPGKTAALGCAWTTFQSGSLARVFSGWLVQSP